MFYNENPLHKIGILFLKYYFFVCSWKCTMGIHTNYKLMLEWTFLLCQHLHTFWDAIKERRRKSWQGLWIQILTCNNNNWAPPRQAEGVKDNRDGSVRADDAQAQGRKEPPHICLTFDLFREPPLSANSPGNAPCSDTLSLYCDTMI